MHFGQTLKQHLYEPWAEHYIDYRGLKELLNEADDDSDREDAKIPRRPRRVKTESWTDDDEQRFSDELLNVQLEKVTNFKNSKTRELTERTTACEKKLEDYVKDEGKDKEVLYQVQAELEKIVQEFKELGTYTRINFTGFMKAAKKHDRKMRALADQARKSKGKGTESPQVVGLRTIKPLLEVRLTDLGFGTEDQNPLLYRLSTMYNFIREHTEAQKGNKHEADSELESVTGESAREISQPAQNVYKSHKFWVHKDNILEVKTSILRRLPMLVYNTERFAQVASATAKDPTISSLYFDNPDFSLYTAKVEKKPGARSLRLRWYGNLDDASEIIVERKVVGQDDSENEDPDAKLGDYKTSTDERITLKKKHIDAFLSGEYSGDKKMQKAKEDNVSNNTLTTLENLQAFIKENNLEPMMRAVYTRTSFQIPGDNSMKATLDTDLRFIREDCLEEDRPCRDPDNWRRADLDSGNESVLRKGEVDRFPYAVLDIQVLESVNHSREDMDWLNEITSSHYVYEVPRFSKFVHGVATLLEDYVNTLPFWLSLMEKDILRDPKQAWEKEQQRRQKEQEDLIAVGSFTGRNIQFPETRRGSYPQRLSDPSKIPARKPIQVVEPRPVENIEEEDDGLYDSTDEDGDREVRAPPTLKERLKSLFGISSRRRFNVEDLPPGIVKPGVLLMHANAPKVEPKVWLANQRTFIKWQHICLLLSALGVTLFNAAGPENKLAQVIALVYTVLALFTGIWGWWVYTHRSGLIRARSPKSLDYYLGPIVATFGLAAGLIINFALRYEKVQRERLGNETGPIESAVEGMFVQKAGGGY